MTPLDPTQLPGRGRQRRSRRLHLDPARRRASAARQDRPRRRRGAGRALPERPRRQRARRPRPGHPGHPEDPQGRLLRLRRLRRGRAADRPGQGRLLLALDRRHRPDLRRHRVQPGAVLHDRPGAAGLPRRRRLGARRRRRGRLCRSDGAAAGVTSTQINRPIYEVVFGQKRPDRRRQPRRRQVQPHRPLTPAPRDRRRLDRACRHQPRHADRAGAREAGSSDIGMYSDRRQSAARSS